MNQVNIRDSIEADFPAIVALNQLEVRHTSAMDIDRLRELDGLSCYHRVAVCGSSVTAFLIAIDDNSAYRNDNYQWFGDRYSRFVYIDRIVVNAEYAGLRIGSQLYQDVFSFARTRHIPLITCEYNTVPANEPSRIFHDKFGFSEVGRQWLANNSKQVSLQAALV